MRNPSLTPRRKQLATTSLGIGLLALPFVLLVAEWGGPSSSPRIGSEGMLVRPVQRRTAPSFDLSNATIPVSEIRFGGVPKDGIPALSRPKTVAPEQATYLKDDERVIGVSIDGKARAYPLSILRQHEVVNDQIDETPIAVTYCPLCDSAVVFDRRTPLGKREFGVSGLLYNSNVLMYDRAESESLWSQVKAEGVSGPGAGKKLTVLPMELTSWGAWRERHPNTDVLSAETGHSRNYKADPYAAYFRQPNLMFPANPVSNALPLKQRVLGIWDEETAIAIPEAAFGGKSMRVEKEINGKKFVIAFDAEDQTLRVVSADEGLKWMNTFWFAWYAFRPQTQIVTR